MKEITTDRIRNIGLVGHAAAGKTSLAEAMLFVTGEISRMGSVDEGSTVSDYHKDEIERNNSIIASILHCIQRDHKFNIIDIPGFPDFIGEVRGGLRASDIAVVVLNAHSGVELGAETAWQTAEEFGIPRVLFANRMDKENVDFDEVVAGAQEAFGNKVVPVVLPVSATEYVDLISMKLIQYDKSGKASQADIPGEVQGRAAELRESLIENAAEADDELLEKFFDAGELTEEEVKKGLKTGFSKGILFPVLAGAATEAAGITGLLDFLIDFGPAPDYKGEVTGTKTDGKTEIKRPISDSSSPAALVFKTISEAHLGELSFLKIFAGTFKPNTEYHNSSENSSEKIGQLYLMNGKNRTEVSVLHAGDIAAVVKLKNTHTGNTLCDRRDPIVLPKIKFPDPLIKIAITPKVKGDEDRMATGLNTLHQEDPAFSMRIDPELHQVLLMGQSELHLNMIIKRLHERFGVELELAEARIPYRETIRGEARESYRHKKQSGGAGQFGEVHFFIAPYKEDAPVPKDFNVKDQEVISLSWGGKLEFINSIVGGAIDARFIPAVKKGMMEVMESGVIAGYPVADVRVILHDGKMHPVDSNENAFKTAGRMCFLHSFKKAKPIIMEPISKVEVTVPDEFMGDVMGDMSGSRGKILGMEGRGKNQLIKALAPEKEMAKYSTKLRSMTQGRGVYTQSFSHYEELPHDEADKLIKAYEEAKAQGH